MIRTPLKLAAAALAAAVTLAGCGGSPVKTGAAATVGDDRITVDKLDRVVDDWRREFRAHPGGAAIRDFHLRQREQIAFDPESPARTALYQLLDIEVARKIADRYRAHPTDEQIQQVSARLGRTYDTTDLTRALGLPARYRDDLLRSTAIRNVVTQRLGGVAEPRNLAEAQRTRQAEQRAAGLYQQVLAGLDIKINPRYGAWRPSEGFVPVTTSLSKPGKNAEGVSEPPAMG